MPIPTYLLDQREHEVQQALRNLRALPSITRSEINDEDTCPICLLSLTSILDECEAADDKQEGPSGLCSGAGTEPRMTGVVRLIICKHIFCRKDLAEWIESHHGSCPTCRQTFFAFTPVDEAEYESSDGGEYIPEEDEDYDDYSDGEFDLVASSEIDYEMDDASSNIEDDGEDGAEGVGYAPLTQIANGEFGAARTRRRATHPYRPQRSDDYRIYVRDDESNEAEAEIEVDLNEHEDSGGLSYGSDSPSSEAVSFNIEDNHEARDFAVSIASGESDAVENRELPITTNRSEIKSPGIHGAGPSATSRNITQ